MSGSNNNNQDEENGNSNITTQLVSGTFKNMLSSDKEETSSCCPYLSIPFWQRYFNVNQSDVSKRIRSSLFLTPPFEEVMEGHPDLYGPFWIYTTIIALLSISANICSYLNNIGNDSEFTYNFGFITFAASLIYGVGLFTPIVMWAIMKYLFNVQIKLIQTICLFGYSEACFVLISILSIIPSTMLHWGLLAYGLAISTIFFFRNVKREMEELDQNQKYIIFGLVIGFQTILCLIFKLYFFKLTTLPSTKFSH